MDTKDTKNVWKELWKEVFQGQKLWLCLGLVALVAAIVIDYY